MKILPHTSRRTINEGFRRALQNALALTGLLAALVTFPAYADDAADIAKLLRAGQHAEAMAKVDAALAQHPRDANMRFLKGVILTDQNKSAEAIAVFTKLTEDFPDQPEPYNNLAVLYFSSGQFDKARVALDAAIRTNPSYAIAYENLGDVHAMLASQAYDKALQLDSSKSATKSKLTLLRSLVGNTSIGANQKLATASAAPAVSTALAPVYPAAAKPTVMAAAQVAATKPEPIKAEPKHEPKHEATQDNDRDDVLKVVNNWASAWSAKDVKSYLGFYGNDFQTPKGESRKAWADERHSRIEGKGRINVKIEAVQVALNGDTATVKFRQIYESDRLKADSRKTLVLMKQGGKWQIKQERAGS